ncbi:MAG: flavin reductase family protein [Candidatus Sigynarchaeum springense]
MCSTMKPVKWNEEARRVVNDDCVVVCQDTRGKNNLITIGWKSIGILWGKPVITIAVHPDRYSHDVIEHGIKEFSLNVGGAVDGMLDTCGSWSGRDVDKVAKTGAKLVPVKGMKIPVIEGAAASWACQIIHSAGSGSITAHTLYFGEIVASFKGK